MANIVFLAVAAFMVVAASAQTYVSFLSRLMPLFCFLLLFLIPFVSICLHIVSLYSTNL